MPTLTSKNPTMLDAVTDEGGKDIVELLNQTNEVLQDATFIEANDGTSHNSEIRTGLPSGTWHALYEGIQPTKSSTVTVTVKDTAGMIGAYSKVAKKLVDLAGGGFNGEALKKAKMRARFNEDAPFIEGLGQDVARGIFYSSSATSPKQFHGLAPRFNDLGAPNSDNIIDAGGTGGDNTSIWLVGFHEKACSLFYPKGTQAGIKIDDRGQQTVLSNDGKGYYEAYVTHFDWNVGLALRDWRSVVRIANIDISDLSSSDTNKSKLIGWMIEAAERIKTPAGGRVAFYCNRRIKTNLRLGILNKIADNLSFETVAGKSVMRLDEYPVRVCDAITNAEARVVALTTS